MSPWAFLSDIVSPLSPAFAFGATFALGTLYLYRRQIVGTVDYAVMFCCGRKGPSEIALNRSSKYREGKGEGEGEGGRMRGRERDTATEREKMSNRERQSAESKEENHRERERGKEVCFFPLRSYLKDLQADSRPRWYPFLHCTRTSTVEPRVISDCKISVRFAYRPHPFFSTVPLGRNVGLPEKITIGTLTWNVGNAAPPKDFTELFSNILEDKPNLVRGSASLPFFF
jgi:hypothetical protein